jgi:glycosyltransferase involved in cell wall biosynthesis
MPERKILIITNRVPYPLSDGGNLAMNTMIQGYHNAGWKVYLLSMNTSRHPLNQSKLASLFTNIYAFDWVDINNDIKPLNIIKNYLFSDWPEHAERFYKQEFEDKIISVAAAFKPDVVQIESVFLATYLPAVNENSDALTVLRLHNIEYQIWQSLAKKCKTLKKLYLIKLYRRIRNFERAAWRDFDLLLPITEKDAQAVIRLEEVNDVVVVPFSIETDKIAQGKDEKWVGYHLGAMDWIPNQEGIRWFLENAWRKIRKVEPGFEFYFSGRNMPERFKKLHIAGVHCLGEVPSAEEFIADKKILIVPLWSSGGIRVKILEAMAAGKVVITTRAGIKGIEAKAGEHYLQVSSPDDFARAVKWCLDNKEAAIKMGEHARILMEEKYEQKTVMAHIINEMERLLGQTEQA